MRTTGLRDGIARPAKSAERQRAPISSSVRTRKLRALSEFNGSSEAHKKFLQDFVTAWTKVMNLDRFDLAPSHSAAAA